MDETGAPGETGQDMMPPSQPPADTGGAMGGGVPQMTDEDLDMLFGGAENKNEEGTEEAGEEETQDPTLKALQDAISAATDEKVIADLARMIVEYTGGGDSEGEEKVLAGLPDGTPLEGVSEEAITEELFRSESFKRDGTGVSDTAAPAAPKPQVAETAKLADDSAKKDGVPSGDTAVKTENSTKGGFAAAEGEGAISAGDPGAGSAPISASEPEEGEKKEDEEDEEEESDEKKDEPEESKSEDADEKDEEPEVEVKETIVEENTPAEDGMVAISDLMEMPFKEVIELVQGSTDAPQDDANVFINGEGEKSIPFTNCDGKPTPIKRSIDDLIRERESTMVGVDGRKYQFTKSGKNARSVDMLSTDLHNYDKIGAMKTGEVLSAFKFMKSIGVKGVEADNMDALDVIVRGFDSKIGSANTDAFMKSAGFDLDAIYKSTTEIKKSEAVQGGKHIKTLAETGNADIKKSGDVTMDVPRAADAGKAYVSPQDMKARLGSIDDLIAGRMKG